MKSRKLTQVESDILVFVTGAHVINSDKLRNSAVYELMECKYTRKVLDKALLSLLKREYLKVEIDEDKTERLVIHSAFEHWLVKRFFGQSN
jgi:hypothetical protein